MQLIDGKQWIAVRKSNLKYYDGVDLFYRNPAGHVVLYKPAGMHFSDADLAAKPFLGELFIRPEDKLRALDEAKRGFSATLAERLEHASPTEVSRIKTDLTIMVDETLSEPRSGSLQVLPDMVSTIIDAYSGQPTVIKHLAWISTADYTTALHSINVMALTVGYCYYTKRSLRTTLELGLAALLHDVGKIDVDPAILTAQRRLTEEEFEQMTRHPTRGAEILEEYNGDVAVAYAGTLHHHRKLDGSGYPPGQTGTISEAGRIIAIIDAYEALTNDDRPYRSAMRPLEALKILKKDTDAGKYAADVFANFAYSLTDFGDVPRSAPGVASAQVEALTSLPDAPEPA